MIRSAGGVAALVTDNTHSALMLPQSAASPDLDTSLATNQHDHNPEGGVSRPEGEHCVGMMNVTKESMWIINY